VGKGPPIGTYAYHGSELPILMFLISSTIIIFWLGEMITAEVKLGSEFIKLVRN
jgi:hypothetical protein